MSHWKRGMFELFVEWTTCFVILDSIKTSVSTTSLQRTAGMFQDGKEFNQPLANWNMSNVIDI